VSKYLIDTNILSEPLKPQPSQAVMEKMQLYFEELAIVSVTWHEILFGCYRLPSSKKRTRIEEYLKELVLPSIPILEYDERGADWHALERARLTAIGQPPAFADGQIAAIAIVNDLILVTNNVSDYVNFQNLKIENWFVS
jgi:tRNA(fMet)-specific endonuclease VapC